MVYTSRSLLLALAASGMVSAIPSEYTESAEQVYRRMMKARALAARPQIGSVAYGVDIRSCTVPGKIALTFDDGPAEFTDQILSTLDASGAKATFFLCGTNGGSGMLNTAYTPALKKMVAGGHQVASHSYSHADFNTITKDQQVSELVKNEELFASIFGFVPTYYRPPYTSCNAACMSTLNEYGYHVVSVLLPSSSWLGRVCSGDSVFWSVLKDGKLYTKKPGEIREILVYGVMKLT
jgi:peptidoglycan/xylan/chitin deacetylase (PgdA/CDA1 family)